MRRVRLILSAAVVAAGFAVVAPAAPVAHAAGCTLTSTGGQVTRTVGGRTYELYVPAGLTGTSVPLMIALHGAGSAGAQHADQTGWRPYADTHNFIVAFPNGQYRTFNYQQGSGDVAWLRQVVADIATGWCVDANRVFASGHSNGAFMAQRLACDAPDLFASAVEYAGGPPDSFSACSPARPVAVGLFHGDADFVVPQQLGVNARNGWVARNGCSTTPTSVAVSEGTLLRYTGCNAGVEVQWRSYPGQGHLWPTGARQQDILDRMWTFVQAHPKP